MPARIAGAGAEGFHAHHQSVTAGRGGTADKVTTVGSYKDFLVAGNQLLVHIAAGAQRKT